MRGRAWITWSPRGINRDGLSNPRASTAHYGDVGGGPCACGRWVPDDFDAIIVIAPSSVRRCKRCVRSVAKEAS